MNLFFFYLTLWVPWSAALSFNSYDLGLHGFYPRQHFHSVDYEPPEPKVTRWDSRCDSGYLFFTPRGPFVSGAARGPVILDARGNLVWMDNQRWEQALNFNVQRYKDQDYLTFWTKTKKTKQKKSKKSFVMLNSSYEVAYTVTPHGKGYKGDSHEFRITPQGTALIAIYHKHEADCTGLGLGKSCWIQDGIVQEIDIETGNLLFEWRATDHIDMKNVYSSPSRKDGYGTSKQDAFDFFHINSIDKIDTGDYIISARYMHAIVCISAKTGEILWQLGGKHNDFEGLNGALDFAWQHHVTWQGNNTITLFDNHANNVFHSPSSYSKGMLIHLNMENMTATRLGRYPHPNKILNVSQGSVQVIPASGNVLVGFGNSPTFVEYTAAGEVLCSAHFAPHLNYEIIDFGMVKSYRVYKSPWVGRPKTVPDVKVQSGKAYVSWNGATEVTSWRLETAKRRDAGNDEFVAIQELERDGFETAFALDKMERYMRIVALDSTKTTMAHSAVLRSSSSSPVSRWLTVLLFLAVSSIISVFTGLAIFDRRVQRRLVSFLRRIVTRLSTLKAKLSPRLKASHPVMTDRFIADQEELDFESAPLMAREEE